MKIIRPESALITLLALTAALQLSACSEVKKQLGLTRSTPDEFAIVKRAPLEMPADMAALPMPRPGAPRPQEKPVIEEAKSALGTTGTAVAQAPSSAENLLLNKTGAAQVNPDIRRQVNKEAAEGDVSQKPVIKRLFSSVVEDEKAASIVDAEAERERLKKNKATGQNVSAGGETPSVQD